eukprot:TRINITY_DN4073_c0_g1_i3.p1 TRINITY_DN4073_c0_g1~~TRINITY_DN4073_c0_g1_i3.p1  ORF type:complete len:433 (+),score=114.83 TRINITY_DN4073_c0_g1_i3:79-1377(+)
MTGSSEMCRDELLRATTRWLEAEVAWESFTEKQQKAYVMKRKRLQDDAFARRFDELLRLEEQSLALTGEDSVSDETRQALCDQAMQEEEPLHEGHFREELRAVHSAWVEKDEAKKSRSLALKALQQAETAAADSSSLQSLRQQKNALYQLQQALKDSPDDIDALWVAISKARSLGVPSRDLNRYEQHFAAVQGKQYFKAHFYAVSTSLELEISAAQRVGELRERLAMEFDWEIERTTMLFNGERLMIDSKPLYECGVSPQNCDFMAAQVQDTVEDSIASLVKTTEVSTNAVSEGLGYLGMQVPQAPQAHSSVEKAVSQWTYELIKAAISKGMMEISAASALYVQVEAGLLAEHRARMTIRNAVQGVGGVEAPLEDIDSKHIKKARQSAEAATNQLSSVSDTILPALREQQAYSNRLAQDLRSWVQPSRGYRK